MKIQIFTLILFLVINLLQAQNPLVKQWDYRFGGSNFEYLQQSKQTSDGGFILGGSSYSNSSGDKTENNRDTSMQTTDYWIVKLDSIGTKQWDKTFGGAATESLNDLFQTHDGGFVGGGTSSSDSSGDKTQNSVGFRDFWIVKIDSLGNKLWDKDFGGSNEDYLRAMQQTSDRGIILGGQSLSNISGDKSEPQYGNGDFWIIKLDSLGNKQWDKAYGGSDQDQLFALKQTADGGYILGGESRSGISGNKSTANWDSTGLTMDYWLVKIDSLGNKEWDKDFGGTSGDYFSSLEATNDGGYLLGGVSVSGISGDKTQNSWGILDYWIIKTDSLGNKQWDLDLGGTANEYSFGNFLKFNDNSFLVTGDSRSDISGNKTEDNLGTRQIWIIKIDSSGNILWDKTIFTLGSNTFGVSSFADNNCIVIATEDGGGVGGYKSQTTQGGKDYWIVKFCDSTVTTSITQAINTQLPFSIYPNPTARMLTIDLREDKIITIISILGEFMFEKYISCTSSGKVDLDVSFLSAGIYFIKADNEVKMFVKE